MNDSNVNENGEVKTDVAAGEGEETTQATASEEANTNVADDSAPKEEVAADATGTDSNAGAAVDVE